MQRRDAINVIEEERSPTIMFSGRRQFIQLTPDIASIDDLLHAIRKEWNLDENTTLVISDSHEKRVDSSSFAVEFLGGWVRVRVQVND